MAIHLLRFSDGRDVVLRLKNEAWEAHAQLEAGGLFYAYNRAWTKRPGRLGLIPRREVERALQRR